MQTREIIVIGSIHYDIFLESRKIPRNGETVKGLNWYPKLGGKGCNQAIAASFSKFPVKLLSAIGKDEFAKYIFEKLKKYKINTNHIETLDKHKTGMSVAISNINGDYGAVIISGANNYINYKKINDKILWQNASILMLQNEIDEKINLQAAKKAKKMGIKVFYNAAPSKKLNTSLCKLVDMLLVNKIEAEDITGTKLNSLKEIKKASKLLSKKFPLVLITAGKKGVIFCKKQKNPEHIKAIKVKVKSTHGAGDTFAGTFCTKLLEGKNIYDAIFFANQKAAEFIS